MSRTHTLDLDPLDLPTIDLTGSERGTTSLPALDRRTYEERFAELGFGLGVVPRKLHRDDPWWVTPAGMLVWSGALLLLLWITASAR